MADNEKRWRNASEKAMRRLKKLIDRPRFFVCREEAGHLWGVSARAISRAWKSGELRRFQAPGTTGPKGYRVYVPDLFPASEKQEGSE